MIRVARGPEPKVLRSERDKRLAQAILARGSGKKVDFSGYEIIKKELATALQYKCAFCERDMRMDGNPVEHFRPKSEVLNEGDVTADKSRYWWLAWTWENLLFACFRCNTCYKRNQFPLTPGTDPLPEFSFDTSLEQPLLLDPFRVEPRDHIRFQWSEANGRGRWIAVAVEGSTAGDKTIRVLGLDEDDDLQRHFEKHIEPLLENFKAQVQRGNAELVRESWEHMMNCLFRPAHAFQAFTWDVLDARIPEEQRRHWGLTLPASLGRHEHLDAATPFTARPELSELPLELQHRVRALGSYAEWAEVRSTLDEVLRLRAWSDVELASLFQREESTIRGWRQRLKPSLE